MRFHCLRVLSLLLVVWASVPSVSALETIIDTAVAAGSFFTLKAALDVAGLTETLNGPGPFTVLAPTDDAFKALAITLGIDVQTLLKREDLAEILTLHVVRTVARSDSLSNMSFLQSLQGAQLPVVITRAVSPSGVVTREISIGSSAVQTADVLCSNGVIHVISSVLIPPQRQALAGGAAGWSSGSWSTVLDGVMGGRSSGTFVIEGKTLVFSGDIKNDGGGFASVRRTFSAMDLSRFAGLMVEVEASVFNRDAAPLALHIQLRDQTSWYSYAAPLAVPVASGAGARAKAFLPMAAFDHASRGGYVCSSGCKLNPQAVTGLEIFVLFQSGPFKVRIFEISALLEPTHGPALPTTVAVAGLADEGAVASFIQAAINSGRYVYDKGYAGLCDVIYWSVAMSVFSTLGARPGARGVMCAGLTQAMRSADHTARAWVLRRTFDAVLADETSTARIAGGSYPVSIAGLRDNWLPDPGAASELAAQSCSGFVAASASPSSSATSTTAAGPMTSTPSMPNADPSSASSATGVPSIGSSELLTGTAKFQGPFVGMGITGYNDLGRHLVSNPLECAEKCARTQQCRSFDYGARGSVRGECWLSTADRASAGLAYTPWGKYDYYERDFESSASRSAEPTGEGGFVATVAFWILLPSVVVVLVLCCVILYLLRRVHKGGVRPSNGIDGRVVVIGVPVADNKRNVTSGIVGDNSFAGP